MASIRKSRVIFLLAQEKNANELSGAGREMSNYIRNSRKKGKIVAGSPEIFANLFKAPPKFFLDRHNPAMV